MIARLVKIREGANVRAVHIIEKERLDEDVWLVHVSIDKFEGIKGEWDKKGGGVGVNTHSERWYGVRKDESGRWVADPY